MLGDQANTAELEALDKFLNKTEEIALDEGEEIRNRIVATSLLGYADFEKSGDALRQLLDAKRPPEVRLEAVTAISRLGDVRGGPVPERGPLAVQISEELDSRWLGPSNRRSIAIRDALTGESLADRHSGRPVTPASTTKLLSAAAIVTALDPATTFATRVVTGERPGEVVIVAGGDMLLADGAGDPEAVAGHAGIGDLAAQTAAALRAGGSGGAGGAEAGDEEDGAEGAPQHLPTGPVHVLGPQVPGRLGLLGLHQRRSLPGGRRLIEHPGLGGAGAGGQQGSGNAGQQEGGGTGHGGVPVEPDASLRPPA